MTYREAIGSGMTVGERIARMKTTEIITGDGGVSDAKGRPSAGRANRFTCEECGKSVELRFDQRLDSWAYKLSYRYRDRPFCSYTCMRAFEKAHDLSDWKKPTIRRNYVKWTPEMDRMACDLYFKEGLPYSEIAKRFHPWKSTSAVCSRVNLVREDYLAGRL